MNKDDVKGIVSLVPFIIFAVFYLGLSLASGDFYRVPMIIAFLVASAAAFALHPKKLDESLNVFTRGMGDANIMMMCLVASPEGVKRVQADHPDVDIYAAALDEYLNEHAYIVPGLGDAGDRIFGTK